MRKVLNFISGFFREDSPESSKRLVVISFCIGILYSVYYILKFHYSDDIAKYLISWCNVTIWVMSGVAAVKDIVALVRGGGSSSSDDDKSQEVINK